MRLPRLTASPPGTRGVMGAGWRRGAYPRAGTKLAFALRPKRRNASTAQGKKQSSRQRGPLLARDRVIPYGRASKGNQAG